MRTLVCLYNLGYFVKHNLRHLLKTTYVIFLKTTFVTFLKQPTSSPRKWRPRKPISKRNISTVQVYLRVYRFHVILIG
jgi:hypothetical protein